MLKKFFAIYLALLAFNAQSAPIGKIFYQKGKIFSALPNQKYKPTQQGQILNKDEILRSEKKSFAIIKLNDGSTLKLEEESKISLKGIYQKEKNEPTLIQLMKGAVFSRVKKGNDFRIRTKNAALGVRGTEFFSAFGKDQKDFWMCVNEGAVEIKNLLSKEKQLVQAGQGILFKDRKKLTAPKPYEWTKKLNWNMDPEKGEVENKQSLEAIYPDLLDQEYD